MFRWWRSHKESRNRNSQAKEPELPLEDAVPKNASSLDNPSLSDPDVPSEAPVQESPSKPDHFRKTGSDWMDEVIAEEREKGNLDHLPGLGKPLHLYKENSMEAIVNDVLKTAHFLPPWIQLQHEIRDAIAELLTKAQTSDPRSIQHDIHEINQKINKYNRICPIPHLQKVQITSETMYAQYEKWK